MPEASIHEACRRGDVDAVSALIAGPALVDAADAVKALLEWLAEYPDDCCYRPITEALRQHSEGANPGATADPPGD